MVTNPNFYGQSTTATPNQIQDGVDFPHTGLLKALSTGIGQNYAISGFNATPASATSVVIAAGVILYNGRKQTVSGDTVTLTALNSGGSHTNGYHLLVAPKPTGSPLVSTVIIRNSTAPNEVAQYTAGDTIIGVITHTNTNPPHIQYLTVNKDENSLSLGWDNSGTYTETGTLIADTNGVTFTGLYKLDTLPVATVSTGDKILIQDADDSDIIKTITVQSIKDLSNNEDADGDTKIQLEESADEDKIRFDTAGAERMIINETGKVGIGTDTPLAPLHIISTDDGNTLLLESTDDGTGLAPDLVFKRTSSSPVSGDNLGSIRFLGMNINDESGGHVTAEHEFADIYARGNDLTTGTEDGELYFRTFLGGTQRRRLDLTPIESVFNEDSQDINFRVESDTSTHMLFVDAALNRIGIGTNIPSEVLDVNGVVGMAGLKRKLVVYSSTINPAYDLATTTLYTLLASAPDIDNNTGLGGNLTIMLPAASSLLVGTEYQIIVQTVGLGDMSLNPPVQPSVMQITPIGSDSIVDELGTVIAGGGGGHTLLQGKIYKMLCIDGQHWMLMQLN
jgi:hypothetical protein